MADAKTQAKSKRERIYFRVGKGCLLPADNYAASKLRERGYRMLDFPTWDEAIAGITDSRFVGHQKIDKMHTNCTRAGARIMYDRLYVLMKSNVELTGSGQVHRPESSDRRERG